MTEVYGPVGEHPELEPYGPLGPHRPEHPQITQLRAERDELRQECAGLRAIGVAIVPSSQRRGGVVSDIRDRLADAPRDAHYRILGGSADVRIDPGQVLADVVLSLPGITIEEES